MIKQEQFGKQGPKDIGMAKAKGKNKYVAPTSKYRKQGQQDYKFNEPIDKVSPLNPLVQIRKNALSLLHKRATPQFSIHSFGSLLRPLLNIYRNKLLLSEREVLEQVSILLNSMRDDELRKLLPRSTSSLAFDELRNDYTEARTIKQINNAYSAIVDGPLAQLTEVIPNLDEGTINKMKERIIRITHKSNSTNSYSLLNALVIAILRICEFYSKGSTFPSQLLPITSALVSYHEDAAEGKLDPEIEQKIKVEIVNVLLNNGQIIFPLIEPLIYGIYRVKDIDYLVTKYLRGKPNKNKLYVRGRGGHLLDKGPAYRYRKPRYYPYSYYQPRYKRLGRKRINPAKYTDAFYEDNDFY